MSEQSRFIQAYPNPAVEEDKRKISHALIFLWIVAVLAILGGLAILIQDKSPVIGWIVLVSGAIYALCALAIQIRHSTVATIIAATLIVLNLLGAIMSVNIISMVINGFFLATVLRAHSALRSIKMRVAMSEQENPLVAYYHALVPLVVEVMKADGRIDPKEIEQFNSMCDKMHVSDMERKLLMDKAMQGNEPISVLVPRFLQAASTLGVADPAGHLIEALLVMAASDRQLHPAEKQVLRKVAIVSRYDENTLERRLAEVEHQLRSLSRSDALGILGLAEGATPEQIEATYQQLRAAANPADYLHLGQAVAQKVAERRELLDKARSVLLAQPG